MSDIDLTVCCSPQNYFYYVPNSYSCCAGGGLSIFMSNLASGNSHFCKTVFCNMAPKREHFCDRAV